MNLSNEDWRSLEIGILASLIAAVILDILTKIGILAYLIFAAILAILKYSYALKRYVIKATAACSRASSKIYSAFMSISRLDVIERTFMRFAGALVRGVFELVTVIFWPLVFLGCINLIARNHVNTPRANTAPTYKIESCYCPTSSNRYTGGPTYSANFNSTPTYPFTSGSSLLNEGLCVNSSPAPRRAKKGKKRRIIYSGLEAPDATIFLRRAPGCDRLSLGVKPSRPR